MLHQRTTSNSLATTFHFAVRPTADAHQIVLLPEPQWTTQDKDTKYNPLAFLENQGFKPQQDFKAWRDENGYKSLRDFMDRANLFRRVTPCDRLVTRTTDRARCGSTTRWCWMATTVTRSSQARTTLWTTRHARARARCAGTGWASAS
ncbi:uncharacterized protein PITG_19818 [Phytophthora infestans T30-4]|uniref:Uncharacterized protein n=1 Tax=Phytophthora infestans (strain T30-4) TaxID=403677 RepID=D0P1K5_PHYIT|nr:uncharacterized protein PITG_19818 [Phytophthora infestans T30-4]EEY54632.1 conserved hypothetical protein [Phytophthora infestans T30-4]|eukprot:XP_002895818.1 conserved hypothetical protein [Phytophthora infestans T30-4]